MVKIHQNAYFEPPSPCAFIDNITILNDESIQACIWECVHYEFCQTAVYYDGSKVCSMFDEHCENGEIQPAGNDPSSVICYRKNNYSSSECSLGATVDYDDDVTISDVTMHPEPANLTLLTGKNESVYGIWKTTAGKDSKNATPGKGEGNYVSLESPKRAFDQNPNTKYLSFGMGSMNKDGVTSGIDTGFYITPKRSPSLLRAVQLYAANDVENRDPWKMTIEGTNRTSALTVGSSWTLIYNGDTGLNTSTPRKSAGALIWLPNNLIWYSSYRLLITSKRGESNSVQYSEVRFFT